MAQAAATRNERGKYRQVNNPYEVWINRRTGEIFQVLKCYQKPDKEATNPNAIRLVAYSGPMEVDTAGHDMYLSDLNRRAILVWSEDTSAVTMPREYTISR